MRKGRRLRALPLRRKACKKQKMPEWLQLWRVEAQVAAVAGLVAAAGCPAAALSHRTRHQARWEDLAGARREKSSRRASAGCLRALSGKWAKGCFKVEKAMGGGAKGAWRSKRAGAGWKEWPAGPSAVQGAWLKFWGRLWAGREAAA